MKKMSIVIVLELFVLFLLYISYCWYTGQKSEAVMEHLNLSTALEQMNQDALQAKIEELQEQTIKEDNYIKAMIADMTLDEKLAQRMILTNEKDITEAVLTKYQPGGIILFAKDFKGKTKEQVAQRVETLQAYTDGKMLVGVDEEGGEVSRTEGLVDSERPVFESARALYRTPDSEKVKKQACLKATFLQEMGINLNFDPVADVADQTSAYMYERSASGDPEEVCEYVKLVVEAYKENHIASCIKHFPGYGNNVNTHISYAKDGKSLEEYEQRDFIPFKEGIAEGADMIMVSHIVMQAVDGEHPASLSPKVHELLREEFDFQGVIITDDLNMKAILNQMTLEKASGEALAAGNDMIFSANFFASMKGARAMVQSGAITEEELNGAVERIIKMKMKLGMIQIPEDEAE